MVGAAMLTACATAQMKPYQPAQVLARPTAYAFGPAAAFDDHMHRFLDDRHTVLYMQNQGGGGVAVGLLLGPLGVLANVAAIKKETETDAAMLRGKLPIDVEPLFSGAMASSSGLVLAKGDAQAPAMAPMLYVEKLDDQHLRFAAWVAVTSTLAGKPWSRQYLYELPEVYTRDALAHGLSADQLAQLRESLGNGFRWIATTYAADVSGTFRPTAPGVIHSDFVTPRIQIALRGYRFDAGAQRIGFVTGQPSAAAVYSLPGDAGRVGLN